MRKENATKWKPSLSSQRGREGCRAQVTKPKADSESKTRSDPQGRKPWKNGKASGLRETTHCPQPAWDTTVAEQAVPTSRGQDLVSAAGSFLQRKDAQLAQEWG